MVIKGKFSKKPAKPEIVLPKLENPFIGNIAALKKKPHQQRAIDILYEIANEVGPLMQHYGLNVGTLQEMSPKNPNLLGLNVGSGMKIQLRLRPHGVDDAFLSMDELVGTMLHELVHNSRGPHDAQFFKKLEEYFDKKEQMQRDGITIHGKGDRLGGDRVIDIRKARLKKLDKKFQGGVHRLGGHPGTKTEGKSLQELVREATIRRIENDKWCHGAEEGDTPDDDELMIIEVGPATSGGAKRSISTEAHVDKKIKKKKATETFEKAEKSGEIEVIDLTSDD